MSKLANNWLRSLGAPEDPVATDTTSPWSLMSLLKALYQAFDNLSFVDGPPQVSTRSELKQVPVALAAAYLTEAGREGMFVWKTGDYSALVAVDTQEGVYIPSSNAASTVGAWVREFTGPVSTQWFGAAIDGTTDDSAEINAAASLVEAIGQGAIWFPPGRSNIGTTTIAIPSGVVVQSSGEAELLYSGSGTALKISGPADTQLVGRHHVLPAVIRKTQLGQPDWDAGTDSTSVGIHIADVQFDTFHIPAIDRFYRGLVLAPENWHVFCNTFHLGRIINNQIGIDIVGDTVTPRAANQNTFIGGAVRIDSAWTSTAGRIYIRLQNAESNSNTFIGVNLEKGGNEQAIDCNSINNVWENCRFEGHGATAGYIEFGAGGTNNTIIGGEPDATTTGPHDNWITDAGFGNRYFFGNVLMSKYFALDFNSETALLFGNGTAMPAVPIKGYSTDRLQIGKSAGYGGARYYATMRQETRTVTSGGSFSASSDIVYLNYASPTTITNTTSTPTDLAGKMTLIDLNGNITISHNGAPTSGQGRFVLTAGVDLTMTAKRPYSFTLYDGNWYQDA